MRSDFMLLSFSCLDASPKSHESERNNVPEELSIAIAYHSLSSVGIGPFRAELISGRTKMAQATL